MSAWICGCDPEAGHPCAAYPACVSGQMGATAALDADAAVEQTTPPRCDYPYCPEADMAGRICAACPVEHFRLRQQAVAAYSEAARFKRILTEIGNEFLCAQSNHAPFHSLHEGYAVLLEEMDELKAEVWKNPRKHPDRRALARSEAIQVATMALRLVHDVLS